MPWRHLFKNSAPRIKVRSHGAAVAGSVGIAFIIIAGIVILMVSQTSQPGTIIIAMIGFGSSIITQMFGASDATTEAQKTRHDLKGELQSVSLQTEEASKKIEEHTKKVAEKLPDSDCYPKNRDELRAFIKEIIAEDLEIKRLAIEAAECAVNKTMENFARIYGLKKP